MSNTDYRIALVGQINKDTILSEDGVKTASFGGLLYSILSLAEFSEAKIYPICNVGQDVEIVVQDRLSLYPNVFLDGIQFVKDQNPHCFLTYDEFGQKKEVLKGKVPEIEFDQIRPFLACDAICFNFVTGMELSLDTLERAKHAAEGLTLMDVHSLTLGIDEDCHRFSRKPQDWESWLACADIVQLNEVEGALLAGGPLKSDDVIISFSKQVISNGSSIVLVTRGARGSQTIFFNEENDIEILKNKAYPAKSIQDETGCGDVFLVGFTWNYLQTGDLAQASRFANRVASINCCLRGIDEMSRFRKILIQKDQSPP